MCSILYILYILILYILYILFILFILYIHMKQALSELTQSSELLGSELIHYEGDSSYARSSCELLFLPSCCFFVLHTKKNNKKPKTAKLVRAVPHKNFVRKSCPYEVSHSHTSSRLAPF